MTDVPYRGRKTPYRPGKEPVPQISRLSPRGSQSVDRRSVPIPQWSAHRHDKDQKLRGNAHSPATCCQSATDRNRTPAARRSREVALPAALPRGKIIEQVLQPHSPSAAQPRAAFFFSQSGRKTDIPKVIPRLCLSIEGHSPFLVTLCKSGDFWSGSLLGLLPRLFL